MKTKVKKSDNVFLYHQINIAKKTIKMPDAILNILGGMTKKEAKKILIENNINY
jgi:hypothetical protein